MGQNCNLPLNILDKLQKEHTHEYYFQDHARNLVLVIFSPKSNLFGESDSFFGTILYL